MVALCFLCLFLEGLVGLLFALWLGSWWRGCSEVLAFVPFFHFCVGCKPGRSKTPRKCALAWPISFLCCDIPWTLYYNTLLVPLSKDPKFPNCSPFCCFKMPRNRCPRASNSRVRQPFKNPEEFPRQQAVPLFRRTLEFLQAGKGPRGVVCFLTFAAKTGEFLSWRFDYDRFRNFRVSKKGNLWIHAGPPGLYHNLRRQPAALLLMQIFIYGNRCFLLALTTWYPGRLPLLLSLFGCLSWANPSFGRVELPEEWLPRFFPYRYNWYNKIQRKTPWKAPFFPQLPSIFLFRCNTLD